MHRCRPAPPVLLEHGVHGGEWLARRPRAKEVARRRRTAGGASRGERLIGILQRALPAATAGVELVSYLEEEVAQLEVAPSPGGAACVSSAVVSDMIVMMDDAGER